MRWIKRGGREWGDGWREGGCGEMVGGRMEG